MRKLVIPSSIQAIQDELFFADAFLFGLKDLSVHFEHTYTLDELKPVIDSLNKQGKQVFLSCNKNYDRHDLNLLSETLNEIETLQIAGVFFYDLAVLEYAKDITLHHHEKYDGTGYPEKLKGNEITVISRLMAIIDVYDALANDRAYKKAMPPNEVEEYIVGQSGKAFDPKMINIFLLAKDDLARINRENQNKDAKLNHNS